MILIIAVLAASAFLFFRGIRSERAWRGLSYGTFAAWLTGVIVQIVLVERQLAAVLALL